MIFSVNRLAFQGPTTPLSAHPHTPNLIKYHIFSIIMARVPKTSRKETSVVKRAQIWTRYLEGHSYTSISCVEGVPYSTVRDIIHRRVVSQDSSFESKPRYGAKRKTTSRADRVLVQYTVQYPRETLYTLTTPLKSIYQLGRNTVRKILKSYSKAKYRPRKKPYLLKVHKKKRL